MESQPEQQKRRLWNLQYNLEQAAYNMGLAADWAELIGKDEQAQAIRERQAWAKAEHEKALAAYRDVGAACGNA